MTSGQQMTGQQYGTDAANARRTGHLISDAVYTKITGLGPWFDSRIAFVDESGPKENRRKRLMVMDQDGANVRAITSGEMSIVAPRYSPATQDIAFMAQATGQQPRVQVINLETGAAPGARQRRFDEREPALLAGRPQARDERAAGRQRRHRDDGHRLEGPALHHQRHGDRHLADLLAGRHRRSPSNRIAAARSRST